VPFYRKIPKHGFNNARFQLAWSVTNVGAFARIPEEVSEVGPLELAMFGLIRADGALVKILGDGEIGRAMTVSAHKFSASAKEKIEKAGGKVVVLSDESAQAESKGE
jgi:large subunit ribosomal protein L15